MLSVDEGDQEGALNQPRRNRTNISDGRSGSNNDPSSNKRFIDRRASMQKSLMQRNRRMSSKNFQATSRRNLLQKYDQSHRHSIATKVMHESNAMHESNMRKSSSWQDSVLLGDSFQDSILLDDSFQINGSIKHAVNEVRRRIRSTKAFLNSEDSQAISFMGDDDDDLLHELEGLSDAEKELVREMEEANRLFPDDEQLDFDGQVSEIDMSWATGEVSNAQRRENFSRLSSIRSMGTYYSSEGGSRVEDSPDNIGDESQLTLDLSVTENMCVLPSKAHDSDEGAIPQNDIEAVSQNDDISLTLGDLFTQEHDLADASRESSAKENVPSVSKGPSSVHGRGNGGSVPNTATIMTHSPADTIITVVDTNNHSERLESDVEETNTMINTLASSVFVGHEYTIRLHGTNKFGDTKELTRTYEGSLLVYLACWVFISYFFGKVSHEIFWMVALIIPPTVTTVEINLPHSINEAVIALGILLCHFVLGKCITM
mmetsp:Transcript_14356/g.19636  ORF Transcript_14356/g.19636 Transcript_14356/m.19636 type:complete len:487 (-) Transcript_14356:564-2024(-)